MSNQKYISGLKNLAEYLGMKEATAKYYVDSNIIPKRHLGRRLMFLKSDVDNSISEPVK